MAFLIGKRAMKRAGSRPWTVCLVLLILFWGMPAWSALLQERSASDACLVCHRLSGLRSAKGRSMTVLRDALQASVHRGLACTDCHTQPGVYDRAPHFKAYQPVSCNGCHSKAAASFKGSFHDLASSGGKTPTCITCHRSGQDAHAILRAESRTVEQACNNCHAAERARFETSVHASAREKGQKGPGCTDCHPVHTGAFPPSSGAVDALCQSCHAHAMASFKSSRHGAAKLACSSCHDVHATSRLKLSREADKTCEQCHAGMADQLKGSAHEALWNKGELSCVSCHRTHQLENAPERENYGCGACHAREELAYRKSAHRLARLHGDSMAASCADCHGGHRILKASNPASPVHARQVPETCGKCHSEKQVFTADHVRLPVSLPSYNASVHGKHAPGASPGATCVDCHGSHALESAASPTSDIHRVNLARTCGKCHEQPSREYLTSVHGRALAHGIKDAPSCTDCHDEHFVQASSDPDSPVSRYHMGHAICGRCHEDPAMASRYGLSPDVVRSFDDSYHGWAITRGGEAVAACSDCHGVHAIGSRRDPQSSIHPDQVVATCAKCHSGATPRFAASYTHVLAREHRMAHDWVRLVYLWILGLVLGGMILHNLVIYLHDLRVHHREVDAQPFIQRMQRRDVLLHLLLIVSFTGLAITGFALRAQDSWWVRSMVDLGFTEGARRLLHRIFALLLMAGSVFHLIEILGSGRGRTFVRDMLPRWRDVADLLATVRHHLKARDGEAPTFDRFDYTQKAEYWALLWGTVIMGATGLVLWFPTLATRWLPPWMVRVAETIHYYEAVLAVSAIVVWHLFFVMFRPGVYPMSWTWITGRMPRHEWETHHGRAAKAEADKAEADKAETSDDSETEA